MKKQDKLQKKRVWEIDALRGFLMFFLLLHHVYFALSAACINSPFSNFDPASFVLKIDPYGILFTVDENRKVHKALYDAFYQIVYKPGVDLFFIISGISYHFSRNNLKNAIRLLCGAAFVSGFTYLLVICTGNEGQFIRFGALHCYATCHLIYYFLLEGRSTKALLLTAAVSLAVGYFFKFHPLYSDSALLVPFGIRERGSILRDYWPIFPMLGWFLIGVALGRRYYEEKVSLFPSQETRKWHKPLQFLGRRSGLIYCGHMVVYTLVFWGIGQIFNLY